MPKPRKPASQGALADFCRSLPGTTEDIKWGKDLVFSVGEKMYCGFDADKPGPIGFKCDDDDFGRLTALGGIIPAPYAARFGWVSVTRKGVLTDSQLKALIKKSYDMVLAKLPARIRSKIASS